MPRNLACLLLLISVVISNSLSSQKLVVPGDFPDPSVVKIGDTYWSSATTSNWAPIYPLMKSSDLINWELVGHVFDKNPDWADYYFWAPEISYENGKVYIYYSAHKKDGNLCVGIASADNPEGPYTDHGPLICQPAGSIDAFPMRDEKGDLYLIWKEDGNSVRQPTPIWASRLSEDRKQLIGDKVELFRNTADWEANLVEGVAMVKEGEYFYAIYAAAGCCGPGCTYATGVARSKTLLGPWEKYEKNPILTSTERWKCPGHGTAIEKDGRHYFLYHAYNSESGVYAGRQGLLLEYRFTPDGWIEFLQKDSSASNVQAPGFSDNFDGDSIDISWQWSVFQKPAFSVANGSLTLTADSDSLAFLGQKTYTADYTFYASLRAGQTASPGIALIGDDNNMMMLRRSGDELMVVERRDRKETIRHSVRAPRGNSYQLRAQVTEGRNVVFEYSTNNRRFIPLHKEAIDASYLPPWDRAVRAGVVVHGVPGSKANFESFNIVSRN